MKGFFNALKHGRLLSWVISALCLFAIIGIVSPVQLPVVLYKLALVSIASIIGYHLDRALFPYSSPGSYLRERWNKRESKIAIRPENTPEYPICDGYLTVFTLVVLRRALIVGAVILGVTLGLKCPDSGVCRANPSRIAVENDRTSPVGAQGLVQFMPKTADWISALYPELANNQPYNPDWALRALVRFLINDPK